MQKYWNVAPFAGAWIEIRSVKEVKMAVKVAPFAGAWIEIVRSCQKFIISLSLPSRERGLKYMQENAVKLYLCRSLRGSVD